MKMVGRAKSAMMLVGRLRWRLAAVIRTGVADFARHGDRSAGVAVRKGEASAGGEYEGQRLQEKKQRHRARDERTLRSLRFRTANPHASMSDRERLAVKWKRHGKPRRITKSLMV